MNQEIFDSVKKIILSEINVKAEQVTEDAKLKDDLGADSIDAVQIVMDLEEEFGIEINDDDSKDIVTVKDLVNYVETLINKK